MTLIVEIKVVPSSGRNKWILDKSGTLKAYLKSPPAKGLANQELIKMIAKALKLPQNNVSVISGATMRTKRIKIEALVTLDDLHAALGIEKQLSLLNK